MRDTIKELAKKYHQRIVSIRRHLHMHPELSFCEEETSKYVQDILEELEIPFTAGWAGHGVVGILQCGDGGKKTLALRADMDALPIEEQNDVPYKSQNQGVMHACGHDVHTSSLIGAAMILATIRSQVRGTIKFIFQPAEEKLPGGASVMIAEGVLKDPVPSGILGQHVHPQLPAGTVGFASGNFMASADEIILHIEGKGGHGATPQRTIDPVLISAHIITTLQSVVSRSSDPMTPSVLTFGKIVSGGGAFNIIPDSVEVFGTFRTFDEEWRYEAHKKIKSIAQGVAGGLGGSVDVNIQIGYPVLRNDPGVTSRCRDAARKYLGDARVQDLSPRMTSEDFAFYTHQVPGCFYRLGVSNAARGITSAVHTPTFDIDEDALETGAGLMAWLAVQELQEA